VELFDYFTVFIDHVGTVGEVAGYDFSFIKVDAAILLLQSGV
jgi:hypothetical protein